jgi:hypothetical protein
MQEFLNPKAMPIPGFAGTFMVVLANGALVPSGNVTPICRSGNEFSHRRGGFLLPTAPPGVRYIRRLLSLVPQFS